MSEPTIPDQPGSTGDEWKARLPEYLEAAIEAARRAAVVQDSWRHRFVIREKAPADLVTEADLATQQEVFAYLGGRFPEHILLGEEQLPGDESTPSETPSETPTWIVDPIDGTVNYAHDCPSYCVSIGLWLAGDLRVGVIFDHRADEMFAAADGLGATLNGSPIQVSSVPSLREALISTGFPADVEAQLRNLRWWETFASRAQALRRTGSTALNMAYVACGRFDGYWSFDNKVWDVAGGVVLIREAGGRVARVNGSPLDPFLPDIVASNGHIQDEFLACLNTGNSES